MTINPVVDEKEIQSVVVRALQGGLPIADQPYLEIANQLGISEDELINMLGDMKSNGSLRRIALVPNHYALGYRFNLMTVWDVDDDRVLALGRQVGELDFVSHCYRRPRASEWPYNLFAMVHGRTQEDVEQQQEQIKQILGDACREGCALRSTRILKKTGLRI